MFTVYIVYISTRDVILRYRVRPRLVCGSEASSAEATHAGLASVRLEVRALGHWRLEHAARTRREAARARVSSLMVTIVLTILSPEDTGVTILRLC